MNDEQQRQEACDDFASEVDEHLARVAARLIGVVNRFPCGNADDTRRALADALDAEGISSTLAERIVEGLRPVPSFGAEPEQVREHLRIDAVLGGLDDLSEAALSTLERFDWLVGGEAGTAERELVDALRRYEAGHVVAEAVPFGTDAALGRAAEDYVRSSVTLQLRRAIERADATIACFEAAAEAAASAAEAERAAAAQAATPEVAAEHHAQAATFQRAARLFAGMAEAAAAARARFVRRLAELEAAAPPEQRPRRVTYCADAATPRRAPIAAHAPPTRAPRVRSAATAV